VAARDFGLDSTPPTINGTAPATTATSPVAVTGTAADPSGIASVTWINAATNATGTATGTISWTASVPLILGPNTIVFFAWDAAGNISSWTKTVTYTPADTTPPVVTIQTPTTSPSYSATSTPLAIGGTATDNVGVTDVRWINLETGMNGAAVLVGSAWTASAPLRFGVNHLEVRTTDAAGNVGVAALRVRFTAIPDAGPPTIMITGPTASPTYSTSAAPMALSGTAGDDVGVAVVRWTNAGTGSAGICQGTTSWTASLGLEPGLNTIAVTAEDAAGNTSTASLQVTFTPGGFDDRPPVLIVLSAPLTATKTPATVSGVAADDVGVAEVVWLNATAGASAAAIGTASWTAQVDLVPGANIITIRSIDTSGNETEVPLTITYSPPSGGGGGGGGGGCGLLGLEVALVVYLARRRSSSR
jgi:hypothetical protein